MGEKSSIVLGQFLPSLSERQNRPERVESEKTAERLERLEGLEGLEGLAFSGQPRGLPSQDTWYLGIIIWGWFLFLRTWDLFAVSTLYLYSDNILIQLFFLTKLFSLSVYTFPTLWNGRLSANPHSCWGQRRDCCLSAHVYVLLILQNAHLASFPPLLVIAHSKYWWMKSLW